MGASTFVRKSGTPHLVFTKEVALLGAPILSKLDRILVIDILRFINGPNNNLTYIFVANNQDLRKPRFPFVYIIAIIKQLLLGVYIGLLCPGMDPTTTEVGEDSMV